MAPSDEGPPAAGRCRPHAPRRGAKIRRTARSGSGPTPEQSRQASASSRARHCDDDAGYWSHDDRRTGTGLRRVSGSLLRPGVSGPRCWNAPGAASYSWQTGWLDHAYCRHLGVVTALHQEGPSDRASQRGCSRRNAPVCPAPRTTPGRRPERSSAATPCALSLESAEAGQRAWAAAVRRSVDRIQSASRDRSSTRLAFGDSEPICRSRVRPLGAGRRFARAIGCLDRDADQIASPGTVGDAVAEPSDGDHVGADPRLPWSAACGVCRDSALVDAMRLPHGRRRTYLL
jgi:hypothetical protein